MRHKILKAPTVKPVSYYEEISRNAKLEIETSDIYERYISNRASLKNTPEFVTPTIVPLYDLSAKIPFVVDQYKQGTCVANQFAYNTFSCLNLADVTTEYKPEYFNSRMAHQYKENLVVAGLNPNYVKGNPIISYQIGQDPLFNDLFDEGAYYAWACASASLGLPNEAFWNYPAPAIADFNNFVNPFAEKNPLINSDYSEEHNYVILKEAEVFSAAYGAATFNFDVHSDSDYSLDQPLVDNLELMFAYETLKLGDNINKAKKQLDLFNYILSQLSIGNPLLVSFLVENNFYKIDNSGIYLPAVKIPSKDILGAHALSIIGTVSGSSLIAKFPSYSTKIRANQFFFKMRNSWGTSWGDNGDLYVPIESFFRSTVDNGTPGLVNSLFTQSVFALKKMELLK